MKEVLQKGERGRRRDGQRDRDRERERESSKKSGDHWGDHNLFEASLLAPDPDWEVDKFRVLLDEALELKVVHVLLGILPQAQDDAGARLARDLILALDLRFVSRRKSMIQKEEEEDQKSHRTERK
jgi:hypothetical protein